MVQICTIGTVRELADDVISGKEDREDFLEAGLSNVQINQD